MSPLGPRAFLDSNMISTKTCSMQVLIKFSLVLFAWLGLGGLQAAQAASANLTMSKSGPSNALAGDVITYQLVVGNNGPDAANGAAVRDALPSGLTALSATCANAINGAACPTPGNISTAGNILTTRIPTFPAGGQVTFTIEASIPFSSSSSYSNTATVTVPSGVTETNPSTNSSTIGTSVRRLSMDLAVTLSGGSTSFTEGVPMTYTATFSNMSGDTMPAGNGGFSFSLPAPLVSFANLTFTCVNAIGTNCPANPGGGVLPTMSPGSSFTISVTFTPTSNSNRCSTNPEASTNISIQPRIGMPSGITDTNIGNNQTTANSTGRVSNPPCPVVVGSKSGPSSLDFSGTLQSYTIMLTNQGPGPADGWRIDDTVSTGDNYTAFNLRLNPQSYTCTTSWGDACPAIALQNPQLGNGSYRLFNDFSVLQWPQGGVISLTILVKPSLASPLPCGPTDSSVRVTNAVYGTGSTFAGGNRSLLGSTSAFNASIGIPRCPVADLQLTRTGPATISLGEPMQPYALTVTNLGPDAANGASIDDTLSSSSFVALFSQTTVACQATGGAVCPVMPVPSAAPGIRVTLPPIPQLPAGGSVTFSYSGGVPLLGGSACPSANVSANFGGTVFAPTGVTDPNTNNNRARTSSTSIACAVLSVNKQTSSNNPQLGDPLTYTITVANASPGADAAGRVVSDALPAGFTYSGGASCAVASGSAVCGLVDYDPGTRTISSTIGSLPANSSLRLVIPGLVTQPGSWVNTASVPANSGSLGSPLPDSATSTISFLTRGVDLGLEKHGPALYTPSRPISYTLIATNYGDAVSGAIVTDTVPSALTNVTWSCLGVNGASCDAAAGSGNAILVTGSFPQGGSTSGKMVITVQGTVDAASSLPITNTAQVAPPAGLVDVEPGNNNASITSELLVPPAADLSISKTASEAFFTPGAATPLRYTVTVSNHGPDSTSAALSELPVAHLSLLSWTCSASTSARCAAASGSGSPDGASFDLAAQSHVTFHIEASIDAAAKTAVVNQVSVVGVTADPDPANNSAEATVRPGLAPGVVNLSLTKNVTPSIYNVGTTTPVTYTLYVQNIGNTAVNNAVVQDTLPAGLSFSQWTCAASLGSCSASGLPDTDGNLHDLVSLAPNGTATYTFTAMVASSVTGNLTNSASITPPSGVTDSDLGDNQSSSTISPQGVPQADLHISQTVSPDSYTPYGETPVTYTIEAGNNGPSSVTQALISSLADAGLTVDSWTCTAAAGANCPASGSGSLQNLSVDLPAGSTLRIVLSAHIAANVLGDIKQTLSIAPPAGTTDPLDDNNSRSTVVTQNAIPVDLGVSVISSIPSYFTGQSTPVDYTITVTNAGPGAASNATLTDVLPSNLTVTEWRCQVLGGAALCPTPDSNTGDLRDISISLEAGASLSFTVRAVVDGAAVGTLTYTAKITEPAGTNDVNHSNNLSTVDITGMDPPVGTSHVDISTQKTASLAQYTPGQSTAVLYTVVVGNTGPDAANGNTLTDLLPTDITETAVVCTASGGAVCPALLPPLGRGSSLNGVVFDLPVGGTLTWAQDAVIAASAMGDLTSTSTASVATGVVDSHPDNNSANVSIRATSSSPVAVPMLPPHLLVLLGLVIAMLAGRQYQRR